MNYHNSMEDYYWHSLASNTTSLQGYCEQIYQHRRAPQSSIAAATIVSAQQQGTMTNQISSTFEEDIFGLLNDQDLAFLAPYYDDNILLPTSERHYSTSSYSASSVGESSISDARSPTLSNPTSPATWWLIFFMKHFNKLSIISLRRYVMPILLFQPKFLKIILSMLHWLIYVTCKNMQCRLIYQTIYLLFLYFGWQQYITTNQKTIYNSTYSQYQIP